MLCKSAAQVDGGLSGLLWERFTSNTKKANEKRDQDPSFAWRCQCFGSCGAEKICDHAAKHTLLYSQSDGNALRIGWENFLREW
jgi:hypothetical protein